MQTQEVNSAKYFLVEVPEGTVNGGEGREQRTVRDVGISRTSSRGFITGYWAPEKGGVRCAVRRLLAAALIQ